ncbi:hypothetical protein F966_00294 [Acinetobacter higginsii]|uniref:Uncharacterized protein n=1 Tax=Acinetobacter higginsii TaxID=70347 RepID=N8XTZ7_9GAMM|nr:hypothetical protein [Acinetobacter higginsii]ENV10530.1 hypothetical protein F966_00294 [Acinetobacter higginsii]
MKEIYEFVSNYPLSAEARYSGVFRGFFIFHFDIFVRDLLPYFRSELTNNNLKKTILRTFQVMQKDMIQLYEDEILKAGSTLEAYKFYSPLIKNHSYLLGIDNFDKLFLHFSEPDNFFKKKFMDNNQSVSELELSNIYSYFCLMEVDFSKYSSIKWKEKILNNFLYSEIISKYKEIGIDIEKEDNEFFKYKLNSLNKSISIFCDKDNQRLIDSRLDVNFGINIPRFLLEALEQLYKDDIINKLAFRVDSIQKYFLTLDEFDYGAFLKGDIKDLPEISRFYELESYENSLFIKHSKDKRHLTFEEICEDFELFNDDVVTQIVHLEYFEEDGRFYIKHIDHEYIIYTLDQYEKRKNNANIKGYKKVKTFKVDNSKIPFYYKYKGKFILLIILESFFKHKLLIKEYFEKIDE